MNKFTLVINPKYDLADTLREVANQIDNGCISGIGPTWWIDEAS